MSELTSAIAYLRSPLAIRARCEMILEAGLAGTLQHFAVELGALQVAVDKLAGAIRDQYPNLNIPLLGRMNHFRAGGVDRVAQLDAELAHLTPEERARAWIDLIVVSVLLDARVDDAWTYTEPGTGVVLRRTEGHAVASLHAFRAGLFSSVPDDALRADASGLRDLHPAQIAEVFQIPAADIEGRVKLLRALGGAVSLAPRTFRFGRPGGLCEALKASGAITAPALLQVLLEALAPIWPDSITVGDVSMGDVGRHPAAGGSGPSAGLVPFHKAAQWLTYSLLAPLESIGITVQLPGALTGLADKRTGSVLVDLGLLVPRHDGLAGEAIVEWRALTIALLDRVAEGVQKALGKTAAELPLAAVLAVASDGTLF